MSELTIVFPDKATRDSFAYWLWRRGEQDYNQCVEETPELGFGRVEYAEGTHLMFVHKDES